MTDRRGYSPVAALPMAWAQKQGLRQTQAFQYNLRLGAHAFAL